MIEERRDAGATGTAGTIGDAEGSGERQVRVEVDGRLVAAREGRPLLEELLAAGLVVQTSCGGKGICHLCRVTLDDPPAATALEVRALGNVLVAQGMRLSCQVTVRAGLQVRLPAVESPEQRRERLRRARARRRDSR